jgi:hypothetical protein
MTIGQVNSEVPRAPLVKRDSNGVYLALRLLGGCPLLVPTHQICKANLQVAGAFR